MQIYYYIGGLEVHQPINYAELSVDLNFDKDDNANQSVSINKFEWGIGSQTDPVDAATIIHLHKTNGINNGVGVFEGLPFKIELIHNGITRILYDGYLDTSAAIWECDRVIVKSFEKGNIDWLSDVADSVSFPYLYEKTNLLSNSDFISIPYVLSSLPNNKDAFLASISLFLLLETIANNLQLLIEYIGGISVLAWMNVVQIIMRVVYLAGLLVAVYALIKRLINLLIQPIKYLDSMRVSRLCEIGCQHFGLTFQSSILYSNEYKDMVILPKKYNHDTNINKDNIIGFLTSANPNSRGYYNGTLGDLLRSLKDIFNAKIIIDGTVLRLEREDYSNSAYNYILPPVDQSAYALNSDDLKSNYVVRFVTDINDKNTLQNYEGTLTQVITTPSKIVNKDMVLMKGLEERNIIFARCTKKEKLTDPELLLGSLAYNVDIIANAIVDTWNAFANAINSVLATLNTILTFLHIPLNIPALLPTLTWTNLAQLIFDRIGALTMENDYVDVAKIGIFNINAVARQTKVSDNNALYINSEYLYENYHFLSSFIPSNSRPNANQYKLYEVSSVPFCFDDYELVRNSNYMQDDLGRNGEILTCNWNVENQTADIKYRINELYTNNLTQETITLDGK